MKIILKRKQAETNFGRFPGKFRYILYCDQFPEKSPTLIDRNENESYKISHKNVENIGIGTKSKNVESKCIDTIPVFVGELYRYKYRTQDWSSP